MSKQDEQDCSIVVVTICALLLFILFMYIGCVLDT